MAINIKWPFINLVSISSFVTSELLFHYQIYLLNYYSLLYSTNKRTTEPEETIIKTLWNENK